MTRIWDAAAHRSGGLREIAFALGIGALAAGLSTPLWAADAVVVPFPHDFAESITATSDGTLIFSSFAGGRISHVEHSLCLLGRRVWLWHSRTHGQEARRLEDV